MSRVVVTGGSGKLGQACVRELVANGWEVVGIDRVTLPDQPCPSIELDLLDFGPLVKALAGADAVVHLAAIAVLGREDLPETFGHNISATYNVFTAARHNRVRNVVWASSETVLGVPFKVNPLYLPIDDAYPVQPQDAYSLGKYLEERMAAEFCRWDPGLKMVGLRLSNVMSTHEYAGFPDFDEDPRNRSRNLWGYVDARDAAKAVRLALEYPEPGLEIVAVAGADTVSRRTNAELVDAVFPGTLVHGKLGWHDSMLSTERACHVLSYVPEHSWRDEIDG